MRLDDVDERGHSRGGSTVETSDAVPIGADSDHTGAVSGIGARIEQGLQIAARAGYKDHKTSRFAHVSTLPAPPTVAMTRYAAERLVLGLRSARHLGDSRTRASGASASDTAH
ncbi:hypothetical protein Pa4123_32850 [Phytohabitans aurantiacus]|uniref:Uncharacterized protein n=1 Tax=Phytohabitans aurantiacus TaxID=3016789 RepID=A0ABQ5QXG1_9ACTN|nr:hypothetical protein Pa4123_32850 [Phytohabitans aurantiacus]